MNKLNANQEWELIVELEIKTVAKGSGKIVSKRLSGNRFGYTGKTKSEATFKAKKAGRYNGYKKEWHIMEIED